MFQVSFLPSKNAKRHTRRSKIRAAKSAALMEAREFSYAADRVADRFPRSDIMFFQMENSNYYDSDFFSTYGGRIILDKKPKSALSVEIEAKRTKQRAIQGGNVFVPCQKKQCGTMKREAASESPESLYQKKQSACEEVAKIYAERLREKLPGIRHGWPVGVYDYYSPYLKCRIRATILHDFLKKSKSLADAGCSVMDLPKYLTADEECFSFKVCLPKGSVVPMVNCSVPILANDEFVDWENDKDIPEILECSLIGDETVDTSAYHWLKYSDIYTLGVDSKVEAKRPNGCMFRTDSEVEAELLRIASVRLVQYNYEYVQL